MMRSVALALLCAGIATGLKVKEESQKEELATSKGKYAYVTMWVSKMHSPSAPKRSLMTADEFKTQFKLMQQEEGLDDETMQKKHMSNLEAKLGGAESAYMGTLKLAQQLQKAGSKYPIVVLTNEPKLLELQSNETKASMYSNVVIKPIKEEDWLQANCKLKDGNELHYQKLAMFGLTEYDRLMWIDTDVTVRKSLDSVLEDTQYNVEDGNTIYGQLDDYMCDGNMKDFCSSLVLFAPRTEHITGLVETAKSMKNCWGDQRIMRKYFREKGRALKTFDKKVVSWSHCNWKKADPMALHEQRKW